MNVWSMRLKPISPNNVLRRWVYPACLALGIPKVSWNAFRRSYLTWAHEKNVPAKIAAKIVGHTNVNTTLNVYTQVRDDAIRPAVQGVGGELFKIVQSPKGTSALIHCVTGLAPQAGLEPATLRLTDENRVISCGFPVFVYCCLAAQFDS